MKVLVVGPVPPPHGGVAVFVGRLLGSLKRRGVAVSHLNPIAWDRRGALGLARKLAALARMFFGDEDVVHDNMGPYFWQSLGGRAAYTAGLLLSRKPIVLNVHQGRFPEIYAGMSAGARANVRVLLRRIRVIICDNTRIRDFIVQEGVAPDRALVLPSFVPFEDEPAPLPPDIAAFIDSHRPLVTLPGWTYSPAYNFDAMLRVCAGLRERFPSLGVLLVVSNFVVDPHYRDYVLGLVQELGFAEHVATVSDIPDVLSVFRRSDVLVRATSSEGSSLSVMEALYLGTPVLATDCAERPPGTVVFPVGDWERFRDELLRLLAHPPARTPNPWVKREAERVLDATLEAYRRAAQPIAVAPRHPT